MKARTPERGVNQSRGSDWLDNRWDMYCVPGMRTFIVVQYAELGSGFRKRSRAILPLRARVFMMPHYRND
jgi:hypothetical protein